MRIGLHRRKSRIRTIVQIGQMGLEGTLDALEAYWNSSDLDECYFSLYYSAAIAHNEEQKQRMSQAIIAAPFRSDRKTEMLRALGISNVLLQDWADQATGAARIAVIQSLNGEAMTPEEFERLIQLLRSDPTIRYAVIPCLSASPLEQAFSYLKKAALQDSDPVVRETIASQLATRRGNGSCELLDSMLEDPVRAVRERAAGSMTAQGALGASFLKKAAAGRLPLSQSLARRYLSFSGL